MKMNTERLAIGGGALVLGLLLGWAVRGVATYNVNSSFNTAYDDWRAFCPPAATEAASCEAMGDVVDTNLKATVARISIVRDKKADNKEMIAFMLPHDVLLDAGGLLGHGERGKHGFGAADPEPGYDMKRSQSGISRWARQGACRECKAKHEPRDTLVE